FFGSNFASEADPDHLPALCTMTAAEDVWIVPTQSLFTRWVSPEPPEIMIQAAEMQYMPARVRHSWVRGKSQIINNPEYSADDYEVFLKLRQRILKCLFDAGAGFLLGSDAPQVFNVPGFSIQHEMRAVVDAGIPVVEVLRSGTINPARFFGVTGEYGEVSVGAAADLILLDANPLEDIAHMRQIAGVMVRGTWLSRALIDAQLAQIAARHESE
ncbi:MAG: amidohydrolase family protein, partial [Saprospiraceae bacterium]|nr:amidohydrolase family protein [Saprospiraceae bacterium]